MPLYRKKPVTIEAAQVSVLLHRAEHYRASLPDWIVKAAASSIIQFQQVDRSILVGTLEGKMIARYDDWIIRGVKGELYPCKPDIFEASYEPVDE